MSTLPETIADLRRLKRHAEVSDCPTVARQVGAAIHHLTPRAPFADVRVKVGDWVRLCYDDQIALVGKHTWEVTAVCPFRGIYCLAMWHRSWIIVKSQEDRA